MSSRPYQNHSEADLLQQKTMYQGQISQMQRERDNQIKVTRDPAHESVREIEAGLNNVYRFIADIDSELAARRTR